MNSYTYKSAGVDIDAGAALVEAIKPLSKSTVRPGVMGGLGGFAGIFDLKAAGFEDPLLLAANDGVGTKLKIAIESETHNTIGIDLVAMCVNDLVVQGAEPLLFLDYYATGALDVSIGTDIIAGIAEGCRQAGCALLGGETAEMPGLYAEQDYDLAGFALGAVERDHLLTGEQVESGDVILGLSSNGLHSNGFSLVRRLVSDFNLAYDDPATFAPEFQLGTALLAPTRIYVKSVLQAIEAGGVHALAHITGGGFYENIPRVLPDHLAVEIDAGSWPIPPVFSWLAGLGGIDGEEMARTFNCGLGMVLVCAADKVDVISDKLTECGEQVYPVGRVMERPEDGSAVLMQGFQI